MGWVIMVLAFGAISMATIVICDLRDGKTHRWKSVVTRRQYVGHTILFLNVICFAATALLLARFL